MIHHGPTLEVNLNAIVRNWQLLKQQFTGDECAAVVKANAYGLGAPQVAGALAQEGCSTFFVATLDEAISLRETQKDAAIYVFHGLMENESEHFLAHRIAPVLNDRSQLERWKQQGNHQPAAVHVDTGMCRAGLDVAEALKTDFAGLNLTLVMSHLSCAGDPGHPVNAQQLAAFQQLDIILPGVKRSLCNSSGIFLDPAFHFGLARPGCSLYGITPRDSRNNPMESVATLTAPILQLRSIIDNQPVGYGATYTARHGQTIATVEIGYADGFHRILSNKIHGFLNSTRVPLVGRVSMDMVMMDVSAVASAKVGDRIEFIGPNQSVDQLADAAQTIGYEIFTRLGRRIPRIYVKDGQKV